MKAGKGDYIGAYLHVHDSNHLPAKAAATGLSTQGLVDISTRISRYKPRLIKFISHVRRWKMPTMLQISEMYNIG